MGRDEVTVFSDSAAPLPDPVPARVGTYQIVREIGRGGMGAVYEALQSQPQRRVALKLIRSDQMSEELLRRFSVEIQALGRLGHVGIARIYEGGTTETATGAQPYFVMELVDGLPLDEYVSRYRIGIRACVTLMIQVAEAVNHAHLHDVIHRDLKPANILVDDAGQPKILDFGVARMVGVERFSAASATRTQVGVMIGTLPYMSPEQTEGDPDHFDQRSDVYALGVIIYKLLTGTLPYRFAGGFIDAVSVIHDAPPKKLGDVDERLRGDLEAVVDKALAKERKHRYQTAQAFADDLRGIVTGRRVSVGSATTWATIRRWSMREDNIRHAGWAGVIGYGLVAAFEFSWAMIGVVAWFWWPPILPTEIRHAEFMLNTGGWGVLLSALGWINWRITRRHVPSMWVALTASVVLTVFCASVLFGLTSYDVGGALREPVFRVALYMFFTALAFLAALASALALMTTRQIVQWNRPTAH